MWNDARSINLIANTLAVLAVLAMLAAGLIWVAQRPYFALQALELARGSLRHFPAASTSGRRTRLE